MILEFIFAFNKELLSVCHIFDDNTTQPSFFMFRVVDKLTFYCPQQTLQEQITILWLKNIAAFWSPMFDCSTYLVNIELMHVLLLPFIVSLLCLENSDVILLLCGISFDLLYQCSDIYTNNISFFRNVLSLCCPFYGIESFRESQSSALFLLSPFTYSTAPSFIDLWKWASPNLQYQNGM